MRRLMILLLCGMIGYLGLPTSANAAVAHSHARAVNWAEHDTAVYVLSTVNLLRTVNGQPATAVWMGPLRVTHFEVWKDLRVDGLYFIQPTRDDGSKAGSLAYRIGWARPLALTTTLTNAVDVATAPSAVFRAFRLDSKRLLASFTSTVPR